jgi:hypothetical protein
MKAIQVKYLPATETKPSRIKAFIKGHSVTRSFDYEHNDGGMKNVAHELVEKLEWNVLSMIQGELPSGDTVFVIDSL